MHFEAELKGTKYNLNVNEMRDHWHISIQPEDAEWREYRIPKSHFAKYDESISFLFDNTSYLVDVVMNDLEFQVFTRGSYRTIKVFNDEMLLHESLKGGGSMGGASSLTSGMPGKIIKMHVKEGDTLDPGSPLLIMEAMKMENELKAAAPVTVKRICVEEGQNVEAGATLIEFE